MSDILFVTARRLSDDDHGAGVRTARLAAVLASQFRVTVVQPAERPGGARTTVVTGPDYDLIEFEPAALSLRHAFRAGSTEGHSIWSGVDAPARALMASTESKVVFWADAVLASAGMGDVLPAAPQVVEFANVESRRYLAMARGGSLRRRLFAVWEARKAVGWQRRIGRRAAAIVTLSDGDAAALRARGPKLVVRNGVNAREHPSPPSSGRTVLAVGSWWYGPNREGMQAFLARDWPKIRSADPAIELVVIGRGGDSLGRIPDGVRVIGFVDDLDPFYDECALVLAPARSGGGSQLKLVGAHERGRIVVGPRFLRREQTPEMPTGAIEASDDMSGTIVRLLRSDAYRHTVEAEILDYCRRSTWRNTAAPLVQHLTALLADRRGANRQDTV